MIAKQVIFKGHVQGVGFRYSCHRMAGRYEIAGFVKNLPDGSVELFAQGAETEVEALLMDIEDYFRGHIRDINELPMNPRYHNFTISF